MLPKLYRTAPVARVGVMPPPAASPGLVLAQVKPVWPAPTPLQSQIPVDERAVRTLPPVRTNPGRVISENIFGGPVTEGDPEVVTVNADPYRDKVVPLEPAVANTEGWTDIFGQTHGEAVPSRGRARLGRGTFGVPRAMEGFGATTFPCAGALGGRLSEAEKAVFDAAGKSCDAGAGKEWFAAWLAWAQKAKAAGAPASQFSASEYAKAVASGAAAPPAGWVLKGSDMTLRSGTASDGTMSTGMKVAIGIGILAAVGGGVVFLKRKK